MKKMLPLLTIISLLVSCGGGQSGTKDPATGNDSTTLPATPSGFEQLQQTDLNKIGDLFIGMSMSALTEKLGKPEEKTKAEVWGADGMLHQDWKYPSKGMALNMISKENGSGMELFSINITAPCTLTTPNNIGIGSSYPDVMTAYKNGIDPTATDENVITVGSLYGGIIFEFREKKVSNIFIGAAAE